MKTRESMGREMKAEAISKVHEAHETDEPCDPERLKVLEEAMREALQAYLTLHRPA
jgi:hypothetical protein